MDVELGTVSRIVLGHSHYDHTGGLGKLRPRCPIHIVAGVEIPLYGKQSERPMHPLGMPRS